MIQFYINSRPVPRAIARHHIAEACPQYSLEDVSRLMSAAFRRDLLAVQRLAAYGVAVAQVEG
jgi:hypothetical protein